MVELLTVAVVVDRFELDPPTVNFVSSFDTHRDAIAFLGEDPNELSKHTFA